MIKFLLGLAIGIIVGVAGIVIAAIVYEEHHPDE
jgi:hypothetical protein